MGSLSREIINLQMRTWHGLMLKKEMYLNRSQFQQRESNTN